MCASPPRRIASHVLRRVGQRRPGLHPSAPSTEVELRHEHVDADVLAGVAFDTEGVQEGLGELEQSLEEEPALHNALHNALHSALHGALLSALHSA